MIFPVWQRCLRLWLLLLLLPSLSIAGDTANNEYVILLHGLWRSGRSMDSMEWALQQAGFKVVNVNHPSRTASVEKLSEDAIGPAVAECEKNGATKIHFVTHSFGGIMVRSYLARHKIPKLGRVVMLGPPNQGSEMVDKLGSTWAFKVVEGPAGGELGTTTNSTPIKLGRANFCLGVIAGDRTINPINSLLIPGIDDGKVSVERTKLEGMTDHIVIHSSHTFLMVNQQAVRQSIYFLREGKFDHTNSAPKQTTAGRSGTQTAGSEK